MYYRNELDETLVMLTLAGEQNAYETLVVRYQKAVILSAMSVTKNHFMAEDAAQDAFVTAWMKLNTLKETQKFGVWVCRIAKNCALNMISRYRSFLPLDVVDNIDTDIDTAQNPAELYALSEERNEVNRSIESLPGKVRQIIHMHYFEGLSIAEIAAKMCISEGTVKWQLHDGRKRIRKELCAMNENYSDTLVQRTMKKVEELKLWQLKNDKSGFEKVYKDVLRDVEDLPESMEKQHALADVLMRGWWWIPGKKNDALFARIVDAAMEGKNEEVMTFIVAREDSKVYGGAKIEFIRDKQIPRLKKAGFVKTLAHEWFWLGYNCFRENRPEDGHAAYDKVREILCAEDPYYALVPYARRIEEMLETSHKGKNQSRYIIGTSAEEYRYIDNSICYWKREYIGKGHMYSFDRDILHIFSNSSRCDGRFFADIALGETFVGSDGTTLTYTSDSETVDTPAGRFEGCQLWVTKLWNHDGKSIYKSYYKDGVGIVRHEHIQDGIKDIRLLMSYNINGGKGLLPFGEGNTWQYASEYNPDAMISELKYTVSFADAQKVIISPWENVERLNYNENSWLDMIEQIRNEYCDHQGHLCNVYSPIERAEALAATPMEKAHTKAAVSVVRRILDTDTAFNPNYTATGHWNFFSRYMVRKEKDSLHLTKNGCWSFEWKKTGYMDAAEVPILHNDVLGILQDAANCIWSDGWCIGSTPIIEYTKWSMDIRTQITCEDGGTVTTKAGTFENCLKLNLNIDGMTDGWSYRGGKKAYYFADGIGIVRTENEFCDGMRTDVYELTSYEGKGKGYMPMEDGFVRRYDALGLTDGFVGAVEYTYVADNDGDIVIFADRTGIREVLRITQYSAIQSEILEDQLWEQGKIKETHALHATNNVHLMLHYIARPSWNRKNADRSIAIWGFNKSIIKLFGDGVEVPPAWCGLYSWSSLVQAAALFGKGEKEAGYDSLNDAIVHLDKWSRFKNGEELSVGNSLVFGEIRYLKGSGYFIHPDGKREPANYKYRLDPHNDLIYYCLTARHGWEWFNKVRSEDRFKQYVEQAKKIADKQ